MRGIWEVIGAAVLLLFLAYLAVVFVTLTNHARGDFNESTRMTSTTTLAEETTTTLGVGGESSTSSSSTTTSSDGGSSSSSSSSTSITSSSSSSSTTGTTLSGGVNYSGAKIFFATDSASPGETIQIAGGNWSTLGLRAFMSAIASDGSRGVAQELSIASSSPLLVQAELPANAPASLYEVWLENAEGARSTEAFVNKPRITQVDAEYAYAGVVVRIFGHNMRVPGKNPSVWFVDASNNVLPASVLSSTPYSLYVSAPALVPGVSYAVRVNNGYGGVLGNSVAQERVRGAAASSDPFGLDVFWAGDFAQIAGNVYDAKTDWRFLLKAKGDGVTDDALALRTAATTISNAGGGVLYLPAGTYLVRSGIWLPSNVVLRGAGTAETTIAYNISACCDGAVTFSNGATRVGVMDVSLQNLNVSQNTHNASDMVTVPPEHSVRTHSSCPAPWCERAASKVFLKNVRIQALASKPLGISNSEYVLLSGVLLNASGFAHYPTWMQYSRYLTIRNSTFLQRVGRVLFTDFNNTVFEGNGVYSDNALHRKDTLESGGIEYSFDKGIAIFGNTIANINERPNVPPNKNDDEMFNSQQARNNGEQVMDYGVASSGGPDFIEDASKNWAGEQGFTFQSFVTILSGQGAGQVRLVVSHSSNRLTVDAPWVIPPAAGSRYALGPYAAYQAIAYGNTFSNIFFPILEWSGGYDTVFAANTISESGGILMRAAAINRSDGFSDQRPIHVQPVWRHVIADNSVTNTLGKYCAVIQIGLNEYFLQWPENLVFANEIRRNSLTTGFVDLNYVKDRNYAVCGIDGSSYTNGEGKRQGYRLNYLLQGFYAQHLNVSVPGIRGTIFQRNRDQNNGVGYDLYDIDPTAVQTVVDRS